VSSDIKSEHLKEAFDALSPTKLEDIDKTFLQHAVQEPTIPTINFYTKSDGVINYQDCITNGPNTINVEVSGSHMGLTHNSTVYENILNFLPNR
jgi:hypothetical protein